MTGNWSSWWQGPFSKRPALPAGNGPDDEQRLCPRRDLVGQGRVRRFVGQVLLAGEEPEQRPPQLGDVVAVVVNHWVEPAEGGDEHGARVELQRVHAVPRDKHFEFMEMTLREPIWRADLFTWDGAAAGNWERAHHHNTWNGMKPTARSWDPLLKQDPLAWTERRLADLRTLLREGGAGDIAARIPAGEVEDALPAIMTAVRASMAEELAAAEGVQGAAPP